MRLYSVLFFVTAVSLYLAQSNALSHIKSHIKVGSTNYTSNVIVAHLLVVCDKEFGDRFNQDRQKMIEYWTTYLWGVNLRFKSLTSVDLSFKMSRLVIIKNTTDQPFVEKAKISDGSLDVLQSILKFANWVYIHQNNATDFDIAILATGTKDKRTHYSYKTNACTKDDVTKRHKSVIVLPFYLVQGNSGCNVLELSLARLLGAPFDADTVSCAGEGYIMQSGNKKCEVQHNFFSKCSDKGIAEYVKSSSASCLHFHDGKEEDDIIKASSVSPHPLSFDDQCRMLTGSSSAFAEMGENPCLLGKCCEALPGNETTQDFYPMDDSPCGESKFCFRGRCLSSSYQIQNVATEKCLHPSNRFSSNDTLVMKNCVPAPYPLDSFRILNMKEHGTFLATPYSSPGANEIEDKCLGLGASQETLAYMMCNTTGKEWLGWDLIETDNTQDEFLIYSRLSKGCAMNRDGSNGVQISQNCDQSNRLMRWKFLQRKPPQGVLVKPLDVITTTYASTGTVKPTVFTFGTSMATTTVEGELKKVSSSVLNDNTSGVHETAISSRSDFETTTSLSVSAQSNVQESSSTNWSLFFIFFILGIVTGGVLFYGVQHHGNLRACRRIKCQIHSNDNEAMSFYENGSVDIQF